MSLNEIISLENGLYAISWKNENGGGISLAAVGRDHRGDIWFSPTNWTTPDAKLAEHCESIESMTLLVTRRLITS